MRPLRGICVRLCVSQRTPPASGPPHRQGSLTDAACSEELFGRWDGEGARGSSPAAILLLLLPLLHLHLHQSHFSFSSHPESVSEM
ncbi:unnamed protein product [Pleuronectes platessa]|uniref:Uncharacterized protein n=1 Tax=Pleuronectes platessa TaxID=8262 RepID=A0A9N7V0A3_PLEPL|nr:unnamed protein product [Pleuronectes platessa]